MLPAWSMGQTKNHEQGDQTRIGGEDGDHFGTLPSYIEDNAAEHKRGT